MRPLWVVGDVHGAFDKLCALLQQAGLMDANLLWTGGTAQLVFLGDYVDRGADGIGVIRLVRSLEWQARWHGGEVTALIGNHEVMFLAAHRFFSGDLKDRTGFYGYWLSNGGQRRDLKAVSADDITWLKQRPGILNLGDWLLLHADSTFYLQLGQSIPEVNSRIRQLLKSESPEQWAAFANAFVDRLNYCTPDGSQRVRKVLQTYGGQRLVHGHSPVQLLLQELKTDPRPEPAASMRPLVYAEGLCYGVDSGMAYFADAGFILRLGPQGLGEVVHLPAAFLAWP